MDASKDALLSDVCISTSAAPTYLPAHHFKTQDRLGKTRSFNLVDGGVAANNPVYISFIDKCNQITTSILTVLSLLYMNYICTKKHND